MAAFSQRCAMWLVIALGCGIVAANFLMRGMFFHPVMEKWGKHDCRITLEQLEKKMAIQLDLSKSMRVRRDAAALAHFFVLAGLQQMAAEYPQPVSMRLRVEKWMEIVLPLSLLVAFFVFLLGKQPILSLLLLVLVNAGVVLLKWSTRAVTNHAIDRANALMQQARIPSEEDEAIVQHCLRAHRWK